MYLSTTPVPPDSIPLQSIDDTSEVHNHKGEDYLEYRHKIVNFVVSAMSINEALSQKFHPYSIFG
jgi:hypothetical protein